MIVNLSEITVTIHAADALRRCNIALAHAAVALHHMGFTMMRDIGHGIQPRQLSPRERKRRQRIVGMLKHAASRSEPARASRCS